MKTSEVTKFICTLTEKSSCVIKQYYERDDVAIQTKDDSTPVTNADLDTETVMRDLIRKTYPEHGIIGEEFGEENTSAEFVWTLDPIDGTISFTHGCPLFGTLVGLLHKDKPVAGAINIPLLNKLCIGYRNHTSINGKTVKVKETSYLSDALLLTTDIESIADCNRKHNLDMLIEKTRLFRTWGDCYGYLLIASGNADLMIDLNMKPWDTIPLIPIIEGANGVITSWAGTAASSDMSCIASNKTLHTQALEILNKRPPPP